MILGTEDQVKIQSTSILSDGYGLIPKKIKANHDFEFMGIKIMPLKLLGHNASSYGYIINDEIVHLGDFKMLSNSAIERIKEIKPKLMVVPLTIPMICSR